ncbi:MAG: Na(+)/H(+) antiporter subunit C [Candidatus Omnitrophica bacterium]|nr:Na(+)/H(+) antiporter subunit C [Candidatus Omnitrophota bacterium]
MGAWVPVVIGVLYATGFYLMMRRSIVRMIMGLVLLSHGTNLLIFVSGGLRDVVPIIEVGARAPSRPTADPLAQAMILTAIVISFAVLAFALVLAYRSYENIGSDDVDELRAEEP